MASIVGKKRDNRTYYYLVESARVDGKPRIVSQQYLGSAEEIAARLSGVGVGEPARTQHRSFGDLAAVWSVLERLDLAGLVLDMTNFATFVDSANERNTIAQRGHAFYCVAALAVAHLMRRQAAHAGITMSVRELLATLGGIEETVLLYQGDTGRPRARHMLTDMTPTQRRLFEMFDLDAYAPTR